MNILSVIIFILEVIKDVRKDGGVLIYCSMTELVLMVLLLMKQVKSNIFIDNLVFIFLANLAQCCVPGPIMKMVQRQNLEYLHTRSHFSYPYFQFMKQLLIMNYNFAKTQIDTTNSPDAMVSLSTVLLEYIALIFRRLLKNWECSVSN